MKQTPSPSSIPSTDTLTPGQARRRMHRERNRRRRLFRIGFLCVLLSTLCLGGGLWIHHLSSQPRRELKSSPAITQLDQAPDIMLAAVRRTMCPEQDLANSLPCPPNIDPSIYEALRQSSLTASEHQIRDFDLLLDAGRFDSDILEFYLKDPDRYDFVKAWPDRDQAQYQTPAATIGDVDLNSMPLLLQWDSRWGYQPYSQMTIYVAGCAPTSMSMVSSFLLKDPSLTPRALADMAVASGDAVDGSGTADTFFANAANQLGLVIEDVPADAEALKSVLLQGKPVIMRMAPGHFTRIGHFIVIRGIDENGMLIVNDPNSISRSNTRWDPQTVVDEAYWGWAFSLPQNEYGTLPEGEDPLAPMTELG